MFADLFGEGVVGRSVEFVREETAEDGSTHKLLLRVVDKKRWSKQVVDLLNAADEDGAFGVSVRKEYYLDESRTPTFAWVLLFWGELEDAADACGPVLTKVFRAPPPPVAVQSAAPVAPAPRVAPATAPQPTARRRTQVLISEDGSKREVTTIDLPYVSRKRDRNAKGNLTRRAYVEYGVIGGMGADGNVTIDRGGL